MSPRVVHQLELVEVDVHDRHAAAGAARVHDRLLDAVAQQCAVRQPGERVVAREVLDAALVALALGKVVQRHHQHVAPFQLGRGELHLGGAPRAVGLGNLHLGRTPVDGRRAEPQPERRALQRGRRPAEQRRGRGIGEHDGAAGIDEQQRRRGRLDDLAQPRLRAPPLGEVARVDQVHRHVGGVDAAHDGGLQRARRAVAVARLDLHHVRGVGLVQGERHLRAQRVGVAGRVVEEQPADGVLRVVAEDAREPRVHVGEAPIEVGDRDDVARALDQRAEVALAALERLARAHLLVDVAVVDHQRADRRLVEQVGEHAFDPAQPAALVQDSAAVRRRAAALLQQAVDDGLQPRLVVFEHQVEQRPAEALLVLVAADALGRGAAVDHAQVRGRRAPSRRGRARPGRGSGARAPPAPARPARGASAGRSARRSRRACAAGARRACAPRGCRR